MRRVSSGDKVEIEVKSSQEGLSEAETASNSSPTKVTEGIYHESLDKI